MKTTKFRIFSVISFALIGVFGTYFEGSIAGIFALMWLFFYSMIWVGDDTVEILLQMNDDRFTKNIELAKINDSVIKRYKNLLHKLSVELTKKRKIVKNDPKIQKALDETMKYLATCSDKEFKESVDRFKLRRSEKNIGIGTPSFNDTSIGDSTWGGK